MVRLAFEEQVVHSYPGTVRLFQRESATADDEESRNSLMAQKSRSFAEFTLSGRRAQDDTL